MDRGWLWENNHPDKYQIEGAYSDPGRDVEAWEAAITVTKKPEQEGTGMLVEGA